MIVELRFLPVEARDLLSFTAISKDQVAKLSHLAAILDSSRIESAIVELARANSDILRYPVLIGRNILRMERVVWANVSVLESHFVLITILDVSLLEVVERFLVDTYSVGASACLHLILIQF